MKSSPYLNSFFIILLLNTILFSSLNAGLVGKGGLYDYKLLFTSEDGSDIYRVYCVEKNSMFSISNHRPVKNKNGKWYDMIDTNKYLGMTFDGLDINRFGEKVCR